MRSPIRSALTCAAAAALLAACGREPTAALGGGARGIAMRLVFPATQQRPTLNAALLTVSAVHVRFQEVSGASALDTMVTFPADADSVALRFALPLAPAAAATGELMMLSVALLDDTGTAVCTGGPLPIVVRPSESEPPVAVALTCPSSGGGSPPDTIPGTTPVLGAVRLVLSSVGTAVAGAAIAPEIVVTALDSLGNIATAFVNDITLSLGENPGGDVLRGGTTVAAVAGVARFPALTLQRAASGYTLVAAATNLASATSSPFAVVHAAPATLAVAGGSNQSAAVLTLLGSPLRVLATDAYGNPVPGVTVTWSVLSGLGQLGATTSQTDADGIATDRWTLGSLAGTQTVTATVLGLAGSPADFVATATALPVIVPGAVRLAMSTVLDTVVAGSAIAQDIAVTALDSLGNVATSFAGEVALALGANPGGDALRGVTSAAAAGGVAHFAGLTLQRAASGYTLVASASGLAPAASPAFSVVHAAAAALSIVGGGDQSGLVLALLGAPLNVLVTDAFGNPVPGVAVGWSVLSGLGQLGATTTQTGADGIATNSWTLGLLAGLQSVAAAVPGLSGSPAQFDATAALTLPGDARAQRAR